MVSVKDGAIIAALIDHGGGAGEYVYRDDRVLTGTFAAAAVRPGWVL